MTQKFSFEDKLFLIKSYNDCLEQMERLRPVTDPTYYESVKNLYEKILNELKGEECSIERL
jgi:hypothetical protein